jgi:EF-hand domain
MKTGTKFQNRFELAIYSNMTVWDLKKLIGEHCSRAYLNKDDPSAYIQDLPCHPGSIRLFKSVGCLDLKDNENGKTLAELRFKHNEILTAYKKNLFNTLSVPLLNLDGTDLNEKAFVIFTAWFNQFSEFEDPGDPNSRRLMDHDNCRNFIRSATDEYVGEKDGSLLSIFEAHDHDRDGYLDLEDFLNFWRASIKDKEYVVRQNLFHYGYRYDLKR